MSQHYSEPERAGDPYALPNVEVFYADQAMCNEWDDAHLSADEWHEPGWYWWSCFPGCMPDSEPTGPFETETEAIADAQSE